ncbi:MAG: conjugal transfer protein TraA [Rickettsia endosymbiont of Platyusa sonomae]|nr:conjugal transfer protein TraA [Rickettsia endosymbiont of Platyusa sonomae]
MNDTNKQINESQEVVAVDQQGGTRNTNPPNYNNSYSEMEYQSNLNNPPKMADLKQKLLLRAESIATSLLGEPNEYLSNNHTLRWGKKGEISMMIIGEEAGIWYDLKERKGGNLFALVQEKKNCNFVEATKYLQGMVDPSKDRAALDELYELDKFDKYTTEQKQEAKDVETTRIKHVQTQYKNSNPVRYLGDDNVVRKYLSERCGIKTASYQLSPDIRGVMTMWDSPSQMCHPALLAFARDYKGTITGVQAIYLDKDNALVNKRCLGKISGSFVEIQKDMSTDFLDNVSTTNITIITGGLENALSLQKFGINGKILCSLGVINIKNYQPQVNECILIAADHYRSDVFSLEPVTDAKAKLEQQGAIVSIVMPPKAGDFNYVLKTQGKEAIKEILVPGMDKLAAYRHKNINPMLQKLQNELKSLEKFATAENRHTALQIYKQQNMEAFVSYSHKVCSIAIEQKIKNDLLTMQNKFDPNYDLGDINFCDVVIRDFNGKSHSIPEDYLVAIVKDKQVLQYVNPETIIGKEITNELKNTSEVQKNQGVSVKPI